MAEVGAEVLFRGVRLDDGCVSLIAVVGREVGSGRVVIMVSSWSDFWSKAVICFCMPAQTRGAVYWRWRREKWELVQFVRK